MEDETGNMSDGLIRQRRNLILTSLFIIMMSLGSIQIPNDAKILGLNLFVHPNKALYQGIWLVFVYFLVRYYQYFSQEPNLGLYNEFLHRMDSLSENFLRREAANQFGLNMANIQGDFIYSNLKKEGFFKRTGSVVTERTTYGEATFGKYEIDITWLVFDHLSAWLYVVFNRSGFTDYFVPFLVALSALLSGLFLDWNGSLHNIF